MRRYESLNQPGCPTGRTGRKREKKMNEWFCTVFPNDLDEMPVVEFSRIFEDLAYTEDGKTLPINYLSAGYQSLLWMLMEMAFRIGPTPR